MKTVVVHLTASRFFGGPERQMLELAKALRSGKGDSPHLPERPSGCRAHKGTVPFSATAAEIRSVFISFSESGLCESFLDEVRKEGFEAVALRHDTPRLLAAVGELTSVLRRVGADVLCCHGYKSNLLGLPAARRLGIPVVSVSRGWTGENFKVRVYEALDRRVLRWMDKVVCVSEGQAAKVRRAGVREDKIAVIHNAVRPERFAVLDPDFREQLRRMFVGTAPDMIVGAAGRLSPEKGFGVLVDAAEEVLRAKKGINVGFVLFGDGPMRDSLARQISTRGLESRFILAGFRSDLDRFLPHLDLMALPSFSEGLPNVALESLAAGVPVVATAVGGTPEVIEDGETGYLVSSGDAAAMAERIISVLSDSTLRTRFAAAGRDRVARRFSFAAQATLYQALFDGLTARLPVYATEESQVPEATAAL